MKILGQWPSFQQPLRLPAARGFTNSVARNLRTLKSCKLLVTVPDISNPFFALILQGIEEAAQKSGYAVLVGDTRHDEMREERYALMLKRKEADGLIFLGHRLPRVAASVVQEAAPYCAPIVNGCEFSILSGSRLTPVSVTLPHARQIRASTTAPRRSSAG